MNHCDAFIGLNLFLIFFSVSLPLYCIASCFLLCNAQCSGEMGPATSKTMY